MTVPSGKAPRALRSDPQSPHAVTRNSNSPASGTGSGTVRSSKAPPSVLTAARMTLSYPAHARMIPLHLFPSTPATSVAVMAAGRLNGKVGVVTGGASGIGLATVRRFVAEGARVMIGDIDGARAEEVASQLGQDVAGLRCDVRSEPDVEALVRPPRNDSDGLRSCSPMPASDPSRP